MNLKDNMRYIKAGITLFAAIAADMLVFFFLYRFDKIFSGIGRMISFVSPFLYGAVIAYLLAPLCNWLEPLLSRVLPRKKSAKSLSIFLALLLAILIMALLVIIVVPQLASSVITVVNALPGQLASLENHVETLLADRPDWAARVDSVFKTLGEYVENWRDNGLLDIAQSILSGTASYLTGMLNFIKNLLIGLVVSVYFLAIRKQFAAQARLLLHAVCNDKWVGRVEREVRYTDRMFNGFLMGKLLDSLVIGILCLIGCVAMGFSSAPLISVIVGVTNIIPFFGPFIGAVPCAFLLLLEKPIYCLMFIIFIIILQQLDGNVIGPKIVGNTTGLSGFWVTFAILLFGGLWGIMGMIIGVPLFAVIYDVLRSLCYRMLRQSGKQDMVDSYQAEFHPPVKAASLRLPTKGKKKKR